MPKHKKITKSQLRPGDILVNFRGSVPEITEEFHTCAWHCMLWVSDGIKNERPMVHSVYYTEEFPFNGILQQSSGYVSSAKPAAVFRFKNIEISQIAAEYSIRWAISSGEQLTAYTKNKRSIDKKRKNRGDFPSDTPLRTPFGKAALNSVPSLSDDEKKWQENAVLKAYQAYWRAEARVPLSNNKGVFCSQMVAVCFQAASIKYALEHKNLLSILDFKTSINSDAFAFSLHKNNHKLPKVIQHASQIESVIPDCWKIYAKKNSLAHMVANMLENEECIFLGITQ